MSYIHIYIYITIRFADCLTVGSSYYLLAGSGVSPGDTLRDLRSLDPHPMAPAPKLGDIFDPDTQKFLSNIQQRGRQAMVSESLARSQRDFDAFLTEKVDLDWEDQRRKIFQHFGLMRSEEGAKDVLDTAMKGSFGRSMKQSRQTYVPHHPSMASRSVFGRSSLAKSVIGVPAATGAAGPRFFEDPSERSEGRSPRPSHFQFYREKMGQYAEKVQRLNLARVQGLSFPVLHEFSDVEKSVGGDVSQPPGPPNFLPFLAC